MPAKTIDRIQERIENTASLSQADRESIVVLLTELRKEVGALPDLEAALPVAAYAEIAAQEATQSETDEGLLDHALQGLRQSTQRFRLNHPRLTSLAEEIASALSRVA